MAGCGNHVCLIEKPSGWGTNGPCICFRQLGTENERIIKKKLFSANLAIKTLEEIVDKYNQGASTGHLYNLAKDTLNLVKD